MSEFRTLTWASRYHAVHGGTDPIRYLMLHANGFNGGTYTPLLAALAPDGAWAAPDFRGHGGSFIPERIHSWLEFVEDVKTWRDAALFDRPVALGHSLGGVTALMAESFYPGTFRAIALLDPVIFAPHIVPLMALAQLPGLRGKHPLAKGARARRMRFASREAVVESYAGKAAFRNWQRPFLENYIRWGTKEIPAGVELSCPGEIEAQIFSTWPLRFWWWVLRVKCPVLILRGAHSDTFWDVTGRRLTQFIKGSEFITIPNAGHFLPMEQPDAVLQEVRAWMTRRGL